jgi:hypothetical protein
MIEWQIVGISNSYDEVPHGARILSVNGKEAIGICEICEKAILLEQDYYCDEDGIYWHKKCDSGN